MSDERCVEPLRVDPAKIPALAGVIGDAFIADNAEADGTVAFDDATFQRSSARRSEPRFRAGPDQRATA